MTIHWAISVLAALAFPALHGQGPGRAAIKMLAVGFLAVIALRGGVGLLALALALSALGDFLLARPGDRAFLAGIGVFGAAHLVYLVLFVNMMDPGVIGFIRIALAVDFLFLAVALGRAFLPGAGDMRGPVAGYIVLLTVMGLAALAVPGWAVPLGAALFILSDSLLGLDRFGPAAARTSGQRLDVWASYYGAQIALTLGLLNG